MTEKTREGMFWIAATLLVATAVHFATLYAVPHLVMARALSRMGAANTLHEGRRPDSNSRMVVRPSPDILYATCPYDLSKGPLQVTARVPHSTYWSISAFDANTDNFYVRNDTEVTGDVLGVVILKRGQSLPPLGGALEQDVVFSPSTRGLVLFRAVIAEDKDIPGLQKVLAAARCATVASRPGLR